MPYCKEDEAVRPCLMQRPLRAIGRSPSIQPGGGANWRLHECASGSPALRRRQVTRAPVHCRTERSSKKSPPRGRASSSIWLNRRPGGSSARRGYAFKAASAVSSMSYRRLCHRYLCHRWCHHRSGLRRYRRRLRLRPLPLPPLLPLSQQRRQHCVVPRCPQDSPQHPRCLQHSPQQPRCPQHSPQH